MDTNNKLNIQEDQDKKLNIVKKVLGIIFCVIILVLSCFIYANGEESKKIQSSMYEKEKQQVAEMTEYLNGIDESVSTNMEHLAQAAVAQADTEKTLKEVTNTLSGMEEQITEVEKALTDTVIENITSSTASIDKSMSETKTELSNQLEAGNKDIQNTLSGMDTKIDTYENSITKNIDNSTVAINKSITETKTELSNQIEAGNKDIQNTLSGMDTKIDAFENNITKNIDASTVSIINSMTETKEELKKQIETGNKEISDILSSMNDGNENNFQQTYVKIENLQETLDQVSQNMDSYYKDLTALIKKFQKQNTEEHEEILAALLEAQDELNKYLKDNFESLNLRMDEDMGNLMEELNVLHNQIIATQNDLTDILNIMEENDSKRQQEVKDMFADTKNYLTHIEETFADAHAKLQDIIIKFKEMEEANHTETLNVLQVMEKDMQETTENGFQNLTETMNSFETSLNSTLDTMQEGIFSSFSSTNSKIESSFQSMDENIDNKFQNINENIENKFSETNGKLENNFQTTNETLNQNFQDVKDSMAQNFTDLNTNITTKNDEMVQNINNNVDEKVANLSTTINNYNESNGDNLEELKRYLNEQLTQVFTSVSNGKSSLASALLTIGTDGVEKDATFGEIYEGIIHSQDVDPSYAATADNISEGKGAWVNGELVIGNGADVNTAYNKGYSDGLNKALNGAHITYVYHQHTGNSSTGGGCYTSWVPGAQAGWTCHHDPVTGMPLGATSNCGCPAVNCGERRTSTHFGACQAGHVLPGHWSLGCGKTTSTIESATISFN